MDRANASENGRELSALCNMVRELLEKGSYQECEELITAAMGKYPHAPQPHNLIGLLLEKKGDRHAAMKHFRAAQALDPTYFPARRNTERFASFYSKGTCAFDETDCPEERAGEPAAAGCDQHNIGHIAVCGERRLNIAEVCVAQTAPIADKKIWEIDLPPEVIVGCILRGDQSIVPRGDTRILAGDVLVMISAGRQDMPAIQELTGRSQAKEASARIGRESPSGPR